MQFEYMRTSRLSDGNAGAAFREFSVYEEMCLNTTLEYSCCCFKQNATMSETYYAGNIPIVAISAHAGEQATSQ